MGYRAPKVIENKATGWAPFWDTNNNQWFNALVARGQDDIEYFSITPAQPVELMIQTSRGWERYHGIDEHEIQAVIQHAAGVK